MRVSGYRVAYASAGGSEPGEATAARLLGDVLSGVGLDELVGESLAHLPLSRELLLALGVPPVRPDRVLLRIAHDTATDSEIAAVLDALTGRGYALSLHELHAPTSTRRCSTCSAPSRSISAPGRPRTRRAR